MAFRKLPHASSETFPYLLTSLGGEAADWQLSPLRPRVSALVTPNPVAQGFSRLRLLSYFGMVLSSEALDKC